MWQPDETRVFSATGVDLRVTAGEWEFAIRHKAEIAAHWARVVRERPRFFNGVVHLLTAHTVSEAGLLSARFVRADFASFLYWRETGWPDRSVMDAFGTALVLSAEGHVLLGRQRAGNLNGNLVYPPSGFIDSSDIEASGRIDIDASVMREVAEETGLGSDVLTPTGTYVVAMAGPVLSIGVPLCSRLPAGELAARIEGHIASDPDSELQHVLFADVGGKLPDFAMPDHARALLGALAHLKTSLA